MRFGLPRHAPQDSGCLLLPASQGQDPASPTFAEPVVQHVDHSGPAALIPADEAAAIVAQQEASFIEHNVNSVAWGAPAACQPSLAPTQVSVSTCLRRAFSTSFVLSGGAGAPCLEAAGQSITAKDTSLRCVHDASGRREENSHICLVSIGGSDSSNASLRMTGRTNSHKQTTHLRRTVGSVCLILKSPARSPVVWEGTAQ